MWVNYSKADGTWSSYRTAEKLVRLCQIRHNIRFKWPMTRDNLLLFVHWLLEERKVKAATVQNYLSGVRQLHINKGVKVPETREELVKQVLKGRQNLEDTQRRKTGAKGRRAMTTGLLKTLKERIRQADLSREEKLLLWTVSTIAFHGVFRIHELLCTHEATFDPNKTLLTEDAVLTGATGGRVLSLRIKCPKEEKAGRDTVVDIFEIGGPTCPIRAWKKWTRARTTMEKGQPLFSSADKVPLTGRKFNTLLKKLLGRLARSSEGTISSHSFRSGAPTLLGSVGATDSEIKAMGRWSSRAFQVYVKGKRTRRAMIARQMGNMVNQVGKMGKRNISLYIYA